MNCVVTGGCGFLGSHLVENLIKLKHNVTVIDDLSSGRINNLNNVKKLNLLKQVFVIIKKYQDILKILTGYFI